jgi:predicted ribosome quality control (RQC) complex YloA/Tae2 family protein
MEFSNIDVLAITRELDLVLRNAIISNVYETEDILILKINSNGGKKRLIIKSDSNINLTEYNYPIPKFPSQYIISLRKLLKNRRIQKISQYQFDRIVVIDLYSHSNEPWKFIIELFNKGNYILIDENNIVKVAKRYIKLRSRNVLPNKPYSFPDSYGKNFLTINREEFNELIKDSSAEVVRTLARKVNISGLYSEEICLKSGVLKTKFGNELISDDMDKLYDSLKKLRNTLLFGEINAHIVLSDDGTNLHVFPFLLDLFNANNKHFFDSFNEAVDEFYSKIDSSKILVPKDTNLKSQIKAQEKILKNQIEYLESLKIKKKNNYRIGDFIYENFKSLEKLLNVISNGKSKGYQWSEINEKLREAKEKKVEGTEFFVNIVPELKVVVVNLNTDEVRLDINKTIGENANFIYLKGKKAKKKVIGTLSAIEETKSRIKKLTQQKVSLPSEINFLIKKPKKKWYEKFRWFLSSDGFLVIGGRDATSNENIFKKYLDPVDLVFHTTFPGSPLVAIKNPDNKIIPLRAINEAASFVASFSRAWKESWDSVEVFYINVDQISKSPPSGEFLPKGSFIISGKKNFVKNVRVELAIGLEIIESKGRDGENMFYPKVISGPTEAIKAKSEKYLIIHPSKTGLRSGALAKEIKSYFSKNADERTKKWIELLSTEDILLYLPIGNASIKLIAK